MPGPDTGSVRLVEILAALSLSTDLVAAKSRDAVQDDVLDVLLPPYNRPHYPASARVLRTPFLDTWTGRPAELASRAAELTPQIVAAALAGGGHEHIPFAGQAAGLIADIRPAGRIVAETVDEASRILRQLGQSSSAMSRAARAAPSVSTGR